MSFVIQHIPHIIPVIAVWGVLIRFWLVQRRLEREGGPRTDAIPAPAPGPAATAKVAPAALPVRRGVALRGLIALGPLIGALATGLVIYALNLGTGHAAAAAIWVHVGISLLAMLLVVYKIAEIGRARLRESFAHARILRTGGSVVLLALWVPLLVSGVALVIVPSTASFTAYAHLIASVWWTGLLLWHLRRYLARAARVVLARPDRAPVTSRPLAGPRAPREPVTKAESTQPRRAQSPSTRRPRAEPEPTGVAAEEGASAHARSR